jgi:hypothetical protein
LCQQRDLLKIAAQERTARLLTTLFAPPPCGWCSGQPGPLRNVKLRGAVVSIAVDELYGNDKALPVRIVKP